MRLIKIGCILAVIGLCCTFSALVGDCSANALDDIVEAIYKAEGGNRAVKPFGVLSVKCEGYNECKRICENTVRNNRIRYQKYKKNGGNKYKDFIEFLGSRYCPVNAENDPQGLNVNWVRNVKSILKRGVK